ncbi:MAG: hypothetical protein HQL52_19415 [Magnetococcales bacterium]|nr:hypothetical protein [Magnetococcales bacterium]
MKNELHVYEIAPIDFWNHWTSMLAFLASPYRDNGPFSDPCEVLNRFQRATQLALRLGWEGDFRKGPFISAIPAEHGEGHSEFLIAWKQDNNGITFIASPFPLPWLADDGVRHVVG